MSKAPPRRSRARAEAARPTLAALILDFDGLILDTETPDYEAWRGIYREFGHDLPIETWGQIVGGNGATAFEPLPHLEELTGRNLTDLGLRERAERESLARINASPPLPGAVETIRAARARGLRLGIASSSEHAWVDGHLRRLGLFDQVDAIICREDAASPKPDPALFLACLRALEVTPREAIALEDSPNGVTAARRAGLFVVAVPNPLTAQLRMDGEDMRLESLADLPLAALLEK
jgi:HAD superfamily hydrolase (TIGR01509 family)